MALVFYAGHGVETADDNYLIPVDASLADAGDLSVEAVPLDTVVDAMSGARVPVVILDASRNDPFAERGDRTTGRPGAGMQFPTAGVLIAHATRPGAVAGDGTIATARIRKHCSRIWRSPTWSWR